MKQQIIDSFQINFVHTVLISVSNIKTFWVYIYSETILKRTTLYLGFI
jgi:hypothetical protein